MCRDTFSQSRGGQLAQDDARVAPGDVRVNPLVIRGNRVRFSRNAWGEAVAANDLRKSA